MQVSLYLIPGLGFSKEIFQNLKLQVEEVFYLEWIEPLKNEGIEDYARRMGTSLAKAKYPIVLLGHSFGGILSQEISRSYPVQKVILVSSAKSRAEIPWNLKLAKPLGIYHLFTKKLTLNTLKYWGESFGYAKGEEQELFKRMVGKQSNRCLQWSLKRLSGWKPSGEQICPIFHVHGDKDMTLPGSIIKEPVKVIQGGTHMMIYNKAKELSEIIQAELTV